MAFNTDSTARDALWLCLHFAHLALEIFDAGDNERPIAIIEQRSVHCANRDNLETGLALATAHALHHDLIAIERQPEREREALHNLAHWAYQFVPGVVIATNNSLLLEIGSCRRLYRGINNLLEQLQISLQQRGQYAATGLAHTPKAAWLLAQCGSKPALRGEQVDDVLLQRQLETIAVEWFEIDGETLLALQQMGLTTLAALRAIPARALGKRFGATFINYLQKIGGEAPDPQLFFTPAPRFQQGLAFIDGVHQRQMLLFPMKRLLQSLCDYLRARQLYVHTLHWQFFDAQQLQTEMTLELSRTHHDWNNLLELSRIKLEQLTFTSAIFSLNLYSEDFFESLPISTQLFPDANDQRDAAATLIDRLQARLGNSALQYVQTQESHWPELAWRFSEARNDSVPTNNPEKENKSSRPLWLLPQPQQLPQKDNQPCWPTPLTLLRGPERIDNHWWQEATEERDYYIARNRHGVICWIFRERKAQQWFLHGLFS